MLPRAGQRQRNGRFPRLPGSGGIPRGGDGDALSDFLTRTDAVEIDLLGYEDYATEEYEGKDQDVRAAVSRLESLGHDAGTPTDKRVPLIKAANLIADFYDLDGAPDEATT